VPDDLTLIPEAYWRIQQLFAATKYTPGEAGFATEDLISLEAKIVCDEEEYNGVKRMKVKSYQPVD
jgi:hypothetical protein